MRTMRERTRDGTRFSGRREIAIGLGVYALYLLASRRKRDERGRARARANAERVVALERRLGIHVEPRLQASLLPHRRLLAVLNVAYVFSNAALTVGWLMRLYGKRHPEFHRFRRAAVVTTLIAQPIFVVFPCAPPRSLDGFVDTIVRRDGRRPRFGSRRATLRPARRDAEHPRRLRRRHRGRRRRGR